MNGNRSSKDAVENQPKKALGQHFLQNAQAIDRIISQANLENSDRVLEIGPGKGALTLPLAKYVREVIAVEKDPRLVSFLKNRLSQKKIENVTIIHQDILQFDLGQVGAPFSDRFMVIGNLPYNISTPLLDKLTAHRDRLKKAVLMFQWEIGQRLTALPGNKSYGAMTVLVQYCAKTRGLFKVSRQFFFPKPQVDAMVLELDFENPHANQASDEHRFKQVVRGAFAHRRKTLLNSLGISHPSLDRERLLNSIQECCLDPGARAETLNIDDFVCLADAIDVDT